MDYNEIKEGGDRLLKSSERIVVAVTVIAFWTMMIIGCYLFFTDFEEVGGDSDSDSISVSEDETENIKNDSCNTYGLNIHGAVVTYHPNEVFDGDGNLIADETSADEIKHFVDEANKNENIKAIIVEIDSYGGSPVGGEEMMLAFKNSQKPVVAFIRDIGASASYLASTGAQKIFASRFSDVGSIGVTYSYLDYSEKNRQEGIRFIELNSGKFKDTGNPDKALTQEEIALYQRDIKITRDYFIQMVAENRKLSIAEVSKLADGSTLMGNDAIKAGLIDEIGSLDDAQNWVKEKIGTDVELCWQN